MTFRQRLRAALEDLVIHVIRVGVAALLALLLAGFLVVDYLQTRAMAREAFAVIQQARQQAQQQRQAQTPRPAP